MEGGQEERESKVPTVVIKAHQSLLRVMRNKKSKKKRNARSKGEIAELNDFQMIIVRMMDNEWEYIRNYQHT